MEEVSVENHKKRFKVPIGSVSLKCYVAVVILKAGVINES